MKLLKSLAVAGMFSLAAFAQAAEPDAAHLKATQEMLASMQAEKMLRMTAGSSKYSDPKQRQAVMDKIEKLKPEDVYKRLAGPVAKLVSAETATEMTHYYQSTYGQKVLKQAYNSGPSLYQDDPKPTAAEKVELKKPAFVKADKAFKDAEPAIRHEVFNLMVSIVKQ